MNKEIRKDIEEEAGDRMDPMGKQMEEEDEDDGVEVHEDYQHCNPDIIAVGTVIKRRILQCLEELRYHLLMS